MTTKEVNQYWQQEIYSFLQNEEGLYNEYEKINKFYAKRLDNINCSKELRIRYSRMVKKAYRELINKAIEEYYHCNYGYTTRKELKEVNLNTKKSIVLDLYTMYLEQREKGSYKNDN